MTQTIPPGDRVLPLLTEKGQRYAAIVVSRDEFLDGVFATLNELAELHGERARYAVAERILPTAQRMRLFPLGTWVNETCGCVIGEMLIARQAVEHAIVGGDAVRELLKQLEPQWHTQLMWFGGAIDARVRCLLRGVLEIDDEWGARRLADLPKTFKEPIALIDDRLLAELRPPAPVADAGCDVPDCDDHPF